MTVQEWVEHILRHVNAEDAESDPSQVPGVDERAAYVRDTLGRLAFPPGQEMPRDTVLAGISAVAPGGPLRNAFRGMMTWTGSSESIRPQLSIQAWVGQNQERL